MQQTEHLAVLQENHCVAVCLLGILFGATSAVPQTEHLPVLWENQLKDWKLQQLTVPGVLFDAAFAVQQIKHFAVLQENQLKNWKLQQYAAHWEQELASLEAHDFVGQSQERPQNQSLNSDLQHYQMFLEALFSFA